MTRAERVIAFVERFCLVPEGALVGRPITLRPFQVDFIKAIYDNPHGSRRAILSIGRKNGKTALIACILLAHIVGPEAKLNSQIVSGALSREQASLVFKLAVKMINLSPALMGLVKVVPSSKTIIGLRMNVEYKALAAEGSTAHGLSPVLAILDEIGQVRGPQNDFIDAITTSQGAHEAPLLVAISTQAPTDADLLSVWIDDAKRSDDPAIVCHVYEAKKDCAIDDRDEWANANPGLGKFRSLRDVEEMAAQAARMPTSEASFRNLILNQRVNTFAPFVSPTVWKENGGEVSEFDDTLVYGGLDLSATTDLTAFVLMQRQGDTVSVQPHFWMPADSVSDAARRDKAPYDVWVDQGLIRTTPGKVIDYAFVAADIAAICAGLNIGAIAFDRWRMDRLKSEFERAGVILPLEAFGQGYQSMSPALDALEADLLQGRVRHGGHGPLTMCAANAVEIRDPAGNRKLDKRKATGRIDGLVALAMAWGVEAMNHEAPTYSPWDDPEFSMVAA